MGAERRRVLLTVAKTDMSMMYGYVYVGGKYSEAGDGDTGMKSTHGGGKKRILMHAGMGDAALDEEKWMAGGRTTT